MSVGYPSFLELMVDNVLCQYCLSLPGPHAHASEQSLIKTGTSHGSQSPTFDLKQEPKAVYDALLSRSSALPLLAGIASFLLTARDEKPKTNPILLAALAFLGTDLFRRAQAAKHLGQQQAWPFAVSEYLTALGLAPPIRYDKAFPDYKNVWADLEAEFRQQHGQGGAAKGP